MYRPPRPHRRRSLRAVAATCLIVATVVASCSGDGAGPDRRASGGSDATTTSAAPTYRPRFEPGPCDPARVPSRAKVDCGTLVVPENREVPHARQVRLPVAILRATATPKQPDPIVYFSGGPGYAGVEAIKGFTDLAPDRDVITFDQRGTGHSVPSLDCPEVDDATYHLFETTDPPEQESAGMTAAFATCRLRLANARVDLSMYDTPTVADDVADLRTALGIDRWNLYGASYGTTVALEVLRRHPQGVRSAVLDSVYPPDIPPGGTSALASAERVFDTLFAGCAADAACHRAHPDLRAELRTAVDRLNTHPYALTLDVDGRTLQGRFTGTDLVGGLFNALYDSSLIPLLPYFIGQVAHGNVGLLDGVAQDGISFLVTAAEGQSASVDCADRQRLVDRDALAAAIASHPDDALIVTARPIPQICPTWDVPSVDASFNRIESTKVPTLVFGDEYDPVTPPADSERTARELGPAATFVRFPGLGHGASGEPCPRSIMQAFVAHPEAKVDTGCVTTMGPPKFVEPG
jgi:pimeloyl-ACP methyl ester carboxylesterase